MSGAFWLVGCGNMGGAMLAGWIASGLDPAGFTVIDPGLPSVPDGVTLLEALPDTAPETVLLAVKPQMLDTVAPALAARLGPETRLLSILAGVEVAALSARFETGRIIRAMPNTPAAIRKGAIALYAEGLNEAARSDVSTLMARLGHAEWIADEALFNAVTALSGSGPAFLYRFIDALAKGGEVLGLPADQAMRLALATVEGSALMAMASEETPGRLADRVASPGGSTREGLNVLDDGKAIETLLATTLDAACRRNAELAEAARAG